MRVFMGVSWLLLRGLCQSRVMIYEIGIRAWSLGYEIGWLSMRYPCF